MTGRASVFSDPEIIRELKENFINVAADVNYLQRQQDAEGEFFRKIAEQGHYAGRTQPTTTRQGLYIASADGELLASINTTSARRVQAMIRKALGRWNNVDPSAVTKFDSSLQPDRRYRIAFPPGGMILRETMRDLPRSNDSDYATWRHNFDHVWLEPDEVKAFVPSDSTVGNTYEIPTAIVRRLAAFHFVDQVKGEADAWTRNEVESARLVAEVVGNEGPQVRIQVKGSAKCIKAPSGEQNPYSGARVTKERAVDLMLRGWLTYNPTTESFEQFDLVAAGPRRGAATYNFRARDLGPAPIGFAFELIPTTPENKTKPKFLYWNYFD